MINLKHTIVLVLKSGGDFSFKDVELLMRHINGKWKSEIKPRIICLWDMVDEGYDLGNIEILPLGNDYPGTWSRMQFYSPEMEKYKSFLYVDLDTAVINSLENIFNLIKEPAELIMLEDFWQKGQLATGLVWFPANCAKTIKVWKAWQKSQKLFGFRMDKFLRGVLGDSVSFWQHLTNKIYDFKPKAGEVLRQLPEDADLVCFHGKPRIFQAAEASISLQWVRDYVKQNSFAGPVVNKEVTVIIPYNKDRGWLNDAVASVPDSVQLILSQGEGNWPQNFNKVLNQAEGAFIKYLHEDDRLTPNCIEDSVKAIKEQNVDFIHGHAIQHSEKTGNDIVWRSKVPLPTLQQLLLKNTIHSATVMYRREVFEKVGRFNETDLVKSFEEYEFNIRCLQMGMKLGHCPTILAIYRRHSNQLIKKVPRAVRLKNREEVKKKYK